MEIVFGKNWFRKHQKHLLWFANTRVGRWVFRIHGKRSGVGKNKIVRIEPNAIWWGAEKQGDDIKVTAEFRTNDKFARRLYYAFKPVWWTMHFIDWLLLDRFESMKRWNFGFATLTQYPWSIGTDNPCDGQVGRVVTTETFNTIRNSPGTLASSGDVRAGLYASTTTNQFNELYRGIACFDTSSLTAGATISAAMFSCYGSFKVANLGSTDWVIVSSAPGNPSAALVSTDYGAVGTTSFGSISYAGFSASGYNDVNLNASGISNISKTSISQFGARTEWDRANSFGGVWASGAVTLLVTRAAVQTGTSEDPKLTVTYTLPGGATGNFFFLF